MTTDGIEAVFLETHNWGKAAKFFQALGFELEFPSGPDDDAVNRSREHAWPTVLAAQLTSWRSPRLLAAYRAFERGDIGAASRLLVEAAHQRPRSA
jgi:hypothetical protein